MSIKRWSLLAALAAAFAAGTKTGVEFAKGRYVSKDRKFIEGEVRGSGKESKR